MPTASELEAEIALRLLALHPRSVSDTRVPDALLLGSDAYGAGVEYFLGIASGGAQWFAYDHYGFPDDLAVRVGDHCR